MATNDNADASEVYKDKSDIKSTPTRASFLLKNNPPKKVIPKNTRRTKFTDYAKEIRLQKIEGTKNTVKENTKDKENDKEDEPMEINDEKRANEENIESEKMKKTQKNQQKK